MVEDHESGVCNDAVDKATVDKGLNEHLQGWCLIKHEELLEGIEDNVDGWL